MIMIASILAVDTRIVYLITLSNSSDEFRKATFLKAKCVQRKNTIDFVK